MSIAKQAGQHGFFRKLAAENFQLNSSGGGCPGIRSCQVCIYAKEYGHASHIVNIKLLAFGLLLVHELENWISWIGMLDDDAGDLEQGSAQIRRSTF